MTTLKFLFLLFMLISTAQQPLSAQVQSTAQTWVILSDIKESAKVDYEKWMTDIFFAPMQSSSDPVLKQQFSTARWQKPVRQNANKTWTYCILLDPAIPKADYSIEPFLVKTYGEAKGKTYMKEYEGFMASAGQILFFETSKGLMTPSVNSEEDAIKKVVIAATDAYVQRDSKAYLDCYVEGTAFTSMGTPNGNPGSLMAGTDIQKFSKGMAGMMEKNKESEMQVESRDGWVSRIKGDMAWISYDQKNIMVKTGAKIKSKELKVLEKVQGKWKITSASTVQDFAHTEYGSPNLEEEAIKQVIEGENAAFNAGDVEKARSFFNFQPYNIGMLTTVNGVTYYEAGEKFNNFYKNFKPSKITATHNNYNIKITGNTAWETNDQTQFEDNKILLTSHQMRCLEKVNGAWKIVTFSAHHSKP